MKTLMKSILLALASSLACSQPHAAPVSEHSTNAGELDSQIDVLAAQITGGLSARSIDKIAIIEFPTLDGKSTRFGKYLAEELTTRLFRTGRFQIVERQLLNKMLEEQKLSSSGLIDESKASRLGRILGVDAIVVGTITDLGTRVKINARLIATETGSVFSVATVQVASSRDVETLLERKTDETIGRESGRFDGAWDVLIACSAMGGGLDYSIQVSATVKGGMLRGQYGTEGVAPCLSLEGRINPDGTALITARGLTGDPRFNIRNARKGMAYFYHIDAKFSETRGKGRRVESRVCDIDFIKK